MLQGLDTLSLRLKVHCENKLKAAESRLEKLVQNGTQVTAEPADLG